MILGVGFTSLALKYTFKYTAFTTNASINEVCVRFLLRLLLIWCFAHSLHAAHLCKQIVLILCESFVWILFDLYFHSKQSNDSRRLGIMNMNHMDYFYGISESLISSFHSTSLCGWKHTGLKQREGAGFWFWLNYSWLFIYSLILEYD